MKITLDKNNITMNELAEAKTMAKDYKEWLTKEDILLYTSEAINISNAHVFYGAKLLELEAQITKDDFKLCLWLEGTIKDSRGFCTFSFNFTAWHENSDWRGSYIEYKRVK